jgi:hypothetical protein
LRSEKSFGQQVVGQLVQIPWGHNIAIISKCKRLDEAIFYIQKTIQNNWSRSVLTHHIESNLSKREGKAVTNFEATFSGSLSNALISRVVKQTRLSCGQSPGPPVTAPVTAPVTTPVLKLLAVLRSKGDLGNAGILKALGLKNRRRMRENYITPSLQAGLINYTIPDKPRSSKQKYRLTDTGKRLLKSMKG